MCYASSSAPVDTWKLAQKCCPALIQFTFMLVYNKPTRTRTAFYSSLIFVQIEWTELQM